MFLLTAEDISGANLNHSSVNFFVYCSTKEMAKKCAENDYGENIDWVDYGHTCHSSEHVSYIKYTVSEVSCVR
jgi:hypothetical protein